LSQNKDHDDKRFKLNRKKHIVLLSILIITIASIFVYIGLVIKPYNMDMNSKKHNPFVVYFHSNLSIIMDNNSLVIPSQIGIDESLWKNHTLDKYGVPGMPMDEKGEKNMLGMAPLYTNNNNGRITIGSIVDRNYTLGEFLNIWGGLNLNNKLVNATVDGKQVSNYKDIILEDNQQIELEILNRS